MTRPFIAIFIINILLWIDFNLTIWRRKKQNETPTRRLRSELTHLGYHLQTHSSCCRVMMLMFRRLEGSLETTVELLGEEAVTFVLMTPILWSLQWIR